MRMRERPQAGAISLTVSQADLARMVGVSRQTLNALLGKVAHAGLVEVGFRRIRVLDLARLADPTVAATATERGAGTARRAPREPSRAGRQRID
jgi:DNA-binding GntR family transcriptional regulator